MEIPSPRAGKRPRIEIIPLIDIIFFLLATFVMVSLSMVKNNAMPVNLPAAAASAAQDRDDAVSITVNEAGELFWNKEHETLAGLPSRLEALKAGIEEPRVFLNGDENARFGPVIAVLDLVRSAGIQKVAIETRKLPQAATEQP
ncbi:MAG: biopolymer transporter ExbD [Candidatus Hydrogenedens sp.]|nr:biopolymer transporter ExbD [Candidatus Hydrogenedens sp.]